MTARITGFVTRAEAGLRRPRSVSTSVRPQDGGVALHWGGPGNAPGDHAGCTRRWRDWQDFHMDGRGFVDIAYSLGVCNHGYALAGRGFGARTAAQGTNDGNDRYLAICWIGGEQSTPSALALDAVDWGVNEFRRLGAGMDVRPHRAFKSTACPGDALARFAASRDGRSIAPPAPEPAETIVSAGHIRDIAIAGLAGEQKWPSRQVMLVQEALNDALRNILGRPLVVDGWWGPRTTEVHREYETRRGFDVVRDGLPDYWSVRRLGEETGLFRTWH